MSMMDTMTNPKDPTWTLKGWHVLVTLLVFFGVMFAVNGLFLYYALDTFSGIDTKDAYRKGIAYNQTLEEGRRYDRLGWQSKLIAKGANLELTLTSEDGTPVRGKKITGKVGRPSTDKFDHPVTFTDKGDGIYVADNVNLAAGGWIVSADVYEAVSPDNTPRFRIKERLWLSQ